jgi:hypothetical protein
MAHEDGPAELISAFFARYAAGDLPGAASHLSESFSFFGRAVPPSSFLEDESLPSRVAFVADRVLDEPEVRALSSRADTPLFDDDAAPGDVVIGSVVDEEGAIPMGGLIHQGRIRAFFDPAALLLVLEPAERAAP